MSSSSDPAERLRAHLRKERETIGRHPSPEEVVAYFERRLPPEDAEEIRAHLAACPDCTRELLALADLHEPDAVSEPGMPRQDLDAAWERQRERLFPASPVVTLESRRPRGPSPRWAWTAAASLALAASLLTVMVVDQRRTIERLTQPQVNPPLVNLAPLGATRQGGQETRGLWIQAHVERVWVILNPVAELTFPSYDVEILAPDGEVVLRFQDFRSSEEGNFRLEIPRGVLKAGEHRILLIGKKEGQRQPVEEFALRVFFSRPSP